MKISSVKIFKILVIFIFAVKVGLITTPRNNFCQGEIFHREISAHRNSSHFAHATPLQHIDMERFRKDKFFIHQKVLYLCKKIYRRKIYGRKFYGGKKRNIFTFVHFLCTFR